MSDTGHVVHPESTVWPLHKFVRTGPSVAYPAIQYGWTCPRCGKVWAPSMPCCDCKPQAAGDGGQEDGK